MRTVCRLFCAILLVATGCTYNPVRYDPVSGFQTGGGVGVLCGGPLDPWMNHCGPGYGCLGCYDECPPACPPAPVCPPVCAPVCPPACPPAGFPLGMTSGTIYPGTLSPLSGVPTSAPIVPMLSAPGTFSSPPVPTFAEPCPTCGPSPSTGIPTSPQVHGGAYPGTTNYSQLFQAPPMAPPAGDYGNQFFMPRPVDSSEIPSAPPMPPPYDDLDTPAKPQPTPAAQQPTPAAPAPMSAQPTPMDTNPMPMPMQPTPVTPEAAQAPAPQATMPTMIQQGLFPGETTPYIDSRLPEGNHIRL